MMDMLLVSLAVVLSTAIWPLNRWALSRGGSPAGIGIVLSVVGLAGGLVVARITHQPVYHPAAFFLGSLAGVAYAIGFVLLLLRCLERGPAGPVVAANGLALAAPVAASLLFPYAPVPPLPVLVGLGTAALALVLLTLLPLVRDRAGDARRARWRIMLVLGWLLTGLGGVAQLASARYAPQAAAATIISQYLMSLLVLLVAASAGAGWPKGPDLAAGVATGLVSAVVLPATFTALEAMPGALAYAIAAAGPAFLVVLLGRVVWKQRLTVWGWLGCAAGVAAIVLVSLPRS